MQAVILAGGYGTRLDEETRVKPKPMIEIGGLPILWHIMKYYSCFGINDFIVCVGYKGNLIKEYFFNYTLYNSDVTIDLKNSAIEIHQNLSEPWKITLVDTGLHSQTGGRLKIVEKYIKEKTFCFTYGDGLCTVDINKLIKSHKKNGAIATLTAVKPVGRYGALELKKGIVSKFQEKPAGDNAWMNGGFFILEKSVLKFIKDESVNLESDILPLLARKNKLAAYKHHGFWQSMDTVRDKKLLEELWTSTPPWKIWR